MVAWWSLSGGHCCEVHPLTGKCDSPPSLLHRRSQAPNPLTTDSLTHRELPASVSTKLGCLSVLTEYHTGPGEEHRVPPPTVGFDHVGADRTCLQNLNTPPTPHSCHLPARLSQDRLAYLLSVHTGRAPKVCLCAMREPVEHQREQVVTVIRLTAGNRPLTPGCFIF